MAQGTEVRSVLTPSITGRAVTPKSSTGRAVVPPQATYLAIDTSHRKKKKYKKKLQTFHTVCPQIHLCSNHSSYLTLLNKATAKPGTVDMCTPAVFTTEGRVGRMTSQGQPGLHGETLFHKNQCNRMRAVLQPLCFYLQWKQARDGKACTDGR